MGGIEKYIEMMAGAGIEVYIILLVFLIGFLLFLVKRTFGGKPKEGGAILPKVGIKFDGISEIDLESKNLLKIGEEKVEPEKPKVVRGLGDISCMCFRLGNILDFTKITESVGEIYQFEPLHGISGGGAIVLEAYGGDVIDYDPRKVEYKYEESPELAWFARHWKVVRDVFAVPLAWWKSPSTWFAAAMLGMIFVLGLVVFD